MRCFPPLSLSRSLARSLSLSLARSLALSLSRARSHSLFSHSLLTVCALLALSRAHSCNSKRKGEGALSPLHREKMASTGAAAEGGTAREERVIAATTRSDARAFDDADESETALLSTAGALSPRAVPPPPDEIVGPPRRVSICLNQTRRHSERGKERTENVFSLFSIDCFFLSHVSLINLDLASSSSSTRTKKPNAALPPERRAPPVPLLLQAPQIGRRPERERRLWRQAKRGKRDFSLFFLLSFVVGKLSSLLPGDQAPEAFFSKLGPGPGPGGPDRGDRAGVDARGAVPEGRARVAAAALVSLVFFPGEFMFFCCCC